MNVSRERTLVTLKEFVPWDLVDIEVTANDNKSNSNSTPCVFEEAQIIFCGTTSEVAPSDDDEDLLLSPKEAAIFAE